MAPIQNSNLTPTLIANIHYPTNPFDNDLICCRFIMKLYALLCICVCITIVHISLVLYWAPFRNFLFQYQWIFWFGIVGYLAVSLITACCMPLLRHRIARLVLLVIVVESVAAICTLATLYYETLIVLVAAIGSAYLCYLVPVVAISTPVDLTNYTFAMTVMGILFFTFFLIGGILSAFDYVPALQLVIAFCCIIVFAIYLFYTTQLILGAKTVKFEENDVLAAAIFLLIIFHPTNSETLYTVCTWSSTDYE